MKKRSQLLNAVLILIGGILLIYSIAFEHIGPYPKIVGLVIIMFGLYRASNHWANTKDDHQKEEENQDN